MKTILLFITSALFISVSAQLVTENFDAFATGDVATDPSGASAGSTGYYIYSGTASDYQITSIDAAHGNSLQMTSGNTYTSTGNTVNNRFVFKPISVPTPGASDEVIQGNVEIYTGTTQTDAAGKMSLDLYDTTSGVAGIGFDFATRKVIGKARLTVVSNSTTGYYNINFGTQTYPDNTWVSVKFIYVISSGTYYWITPEGVFTFSNPSYSTTPGLSFAEYDFINFTSPNNTTSNVAVFDNLVLKYDTLANADVDDVQTVGLVSNVNIYPNPATNFVKINTEEKIISVQLYDLTGKQISVNSTDGVVDVSSLASGDYILNVTTDVGESSHKIIKK